MTIKQFLTKYWYLTAGVVGVLSGIAVTSLGDAFMELWFMPGIIFGIFSGVYFFFALPSRPAYWKLVLWGVFSSLSFFFSSFYWYWRS